MEEAHIDEGSLAADEVEIENLFDKNTDSFKCLAQIFVSRSSIFRHPLYPFPPLKDPELDKAINYQETPQVYDDIGCDNYQRLCKKFGIVMFTRVWKSLPTKLLNLKYYGLREKQVEAIMDTLRRNKCVEHVILQDSWLSTKSIEHIKEMLKKNTTIQILNLKECRIKPEGGAILSEGIESSLSLKQLDLSFNSLDDPGLILLEDGLYHNSSIKILNLSHNNIGEAAAEVLASILGYNTVLEDLDLSWNNFYSPLGNKIIFAAMSDNPVIKKLNLAFNNIGTSAATRPIMNYLMKPSALEYFDISNNRLTDDSFKNIRGGIAKCKQLTMIKFGNNPLKPDEALSLLRCFSAVPKLGEINMENIFVNKNFISVWEQYQKRGKKVTIGGVLGNYVIHGPDTIKLLFERARFTAMKGKKDFGVFLFQLPAENIPEEEFEAAVKKYKMKKVDGDLIKGIINKFPGQKYHVNCKDMQDRYLSYYPDTVIPKAKKGADEEKLPQDIEEQIGNYLKEIQNEDEYEAQYE